MTPPVARARGAWLAAAAPASAALLALAACADPPHAPRPPGATPAPRAAKDGPAPDSADGYLVFLKPAHADERRRRGSPDHAPRAALAADVARRARATTAQPLAFVDAAVLRGPVDVAALAADPRVARVAPNTLERKLGFPTDALFWRRGWQWNLRQIEADAAAATGAGRTVCVVDGGVDPRHQDLAGKVALARAFPGAAPYAADFDADGHGTHVAGTVTSNGIGAAAAAPGARLLNANVFGPDAATSVARVADAVAWCARSGADVINLSLGGPRARGSAAWSADSATYAAAAGDARALGAVVVAAAGNSGLAVPGPSAFLPAEAPGVLAVGATAPPPATPFPFATPAPHPLYDALPAYSNRNSGDDALGAGVRLYAPGGANGLRAPLNVTAACAPSAGPACADGVRYHALAGTSMAAPHVAAVAALVASRGPGARSPVRVDAIEACLLATADRLPAGAPFFGRGRVNARRATTEPCPGVE